MKRIVAASIVVLCATARAEAEKPTPIVLHVAPGSNPTSMAYEKEAIVVANGKRISGTFNITNRHSDEKTILVHQLAPGDTLTVSARFGDEAEDPAICQRTWSAVRQNSIGCGPIQIVYQPTTNSCTLVCN